MTRITRDVPWFPMKRAVNVKDRKTLFMKLPSAPVDETEDEVDEEIDKEDNGWVTSDQTLLPPLVQEGPRPNLFRDSAKKRSIFQNRGSALVSSHSNSHHNGQYGSFASTTKGPTLKKTKKKVLKKCSSSVEKGTIKASCINNILDRDYSNEYKDRVSEQNGFPNIPFFSEWKISGFKYDKVILSRLTNMSEKQEVTPEFVTYIKERDAALKEAADARAELRDTQSRLYDALQLIESLEKKTGERKKTSKKSVASKKKTDKPNGLATKTSTCLASSGVSSARTSAQVSARTDGRLYHPPIDAVDPSADSKEYYWKIAEKFSQLPMFTILDAERKFIKADADVSGTIDIDEMDRVLSESVGMFTPKQLADIMAEMDTDKSGTLDFMEVLTVINRLVSHRKTNLPQSMQQNYSKTCSIQ